MTTSLITGASGFVGANLARRLVRDGHKVHLVIRPERDHWRLADLLADVRVHHTDLTDRRRLEAIVAGIQPEWIFHLAAHGAYSWQTDLDEMVAVNVIGTMNLVRACLRTGFSSFVNTGSSSEYGLKDHAPAESESVDPDSHYAVTKAAATQFCRFTAREYAVSIPTLRLYSAYGPWEEPRRLVPTLLTAARAGRLPPLVNPDIARDYVYVADVVEALLLAATHKHRDPGVIYNVGTGIQTTLRQMVDLVQRILPVSDKPVWGSMANRPWDTITWLANSDKIQCELGWQPQVDVVGGLKATLAWLLEHPEVSDRYDPSGLE